MRTHSGEKPFSCNQCNFSRTTASYLKIHIRTHSGGKPFMCDQCDYSSTQVQHLKTHILTHTGARPFTCNQCSYSCNRSDRMKCHMLSHTDEMPFACKQRNYSCTRSTLLETHMMRKHCPNKKWIGFPHISQKFLLHPAGISFDEWIKLGATYAISELWSRASILDTFRLPHRR